MPFLSQSVNIDSHELPAPIDLDGEYERFGVLVEYGSANVKALSFIWRRETLDERAVFAPAFCLPVCPVLRLDVVPSGHDSLGANGEEREPSSR